MRQSGAQDRSKEAHSTRPAVLLVPIISPVPLPEFLRKFPCSVRRGSTRRRDYFRGFIPYKFGYLVNYSFPHRCVAAPFALAACQRSLLDLDTLPARRTLGLASLQPPELPNPPQQFDTRPLEMPGRPPPAPPRHQHVSDHPKQRSSTPRARFLSTYLRSYHRSTSPSTYPPRTSPPTP